MNGNRGRARCEGFPERLKKLREGAGYTQATLAAALGIHPRTVQGWENTKDPREPALSDLAALASCLGVTSDFLLGLDTEKNAPLKDAADALGISQEAAGKLMRFAAREEVQQLQGTIPDKREPRNLALNGLVCAPGWDVFCWNLLSLRRELTAWADNPQRGQATSAPFSLTLSGSNYFYYKFEQLSNHFSDMLAGLLDLERYTRFGEQTLLRTENERRAVDEAIKAVRAAQSEYTANADEGGVDYGR